MSIDRAYKGTLNKTVELFDDGMCDGPDLEIGRQYLMYTRTTLTGVFAGARLYKEPRE